MPRENAKKHFSAITPVALTAGPEKWKTPHGTTANPNEKNYEKHVAVDDVLRILVNDQRKNALLPRRFIRLTHELVNLSGPDSWPLYLPLNPVHELRGGVEAVKGRTIWPALH